MFDAQRAQLKNAVKVKTKIHLIFNIVFSAFIAVLANPALVTSSYSGALPVILFSVITFASMITVLTFTGPIWNSAFWFYKLVIFGSAAKIMLFLADFCYVNYSDDRVAGSTAMNHVSFWLIIWMLPLLMILLYSKARSLILGYIAKTNNRFALAVFSFFSTYSILFLPPKAQSKTNMKKSHIVCASVSILLFFMGAALLTAAAWTDKYFHKIGFAAVIFNVKYSPNAMSAQMYSVIAACVGVVISATLVYAVFAFNRIRYENLNAFCFNTAISRRIKPFAKRRLGIVTVGFFAFVYGAVTCINAVGLYEYAKLKLQKSSVYEDYYVTPSADNITFPENKRNLIYIYLESMENTYSSYENGGNYEIDYIPELTKLANENINFSHTSGLGGQSVFLPETAYTMGSTVAQTSGVTLVTPMGLSRNEMDQYSSFLPGLTTLEDVLYENGYNQLFIRGEDTTFAGYSSYVGRYDTSSIFDYNYAIENGYIPEDYRVHWGFEDAKLFDFVRDETLRLAEQDAPFCITLYTADTHGSEQGFECEVCENPYDNTYANAIDCSSNLTYDYIAWLSEQSFFENTTIILYGDHLSELPADNGFIKADSYVRTTYNCIINSAAEPVNEKNRTFCALDMFPTTLSAIGAEIEGDRLGLGTDLFSSTPTLCEELGAEKFVLEIQKRSDYYNENFWLLS